MRIIAEFDIDGIKISVFKMDDRISAKYEYNLLEQTYKFNEDDNLRTMADIEKLVDETFLNECLKRFSDMNKSRGETYQRNIQ